MSEPGQIPLRLAVVGLGPIGLEVARQALQKRAFELVGLVDPAPGLAGRLAEELGLAGSRGLTVESELGAVLERASPDLAVVATGSALERVAPDLIRLASAGVSVASPCEELLWPVLDHSALAVEIDRAARRGGAAVVGTGINPGFVLDYLPAVLSAACRKVRGVRATRVLDAALRRRPLQRKVGAGLEVATFEREVAAGRLGHVGMRQSVALVAAALGLELSSIRQTAEPVVAEHEVRGQELTVAAGQVAGIRNVGLGERGDEVVVRLELQMYVGATDCRDELILEASPPLHFLLPGGIPGDQATASILLHTAARAAAAPPGLKTVLDLPPPIYLP